MKLRCIQLILLLLTWLCLAPVVFAYEIVPEVGLRVEFHDNPSQSALGGDSDIALLPYGGLKIMHEGERLVASIDVQLEYERYQDSTFSDDTRLYADAYLGFSIIPGRLIWNIQDTATIQTIEPFGFVLPDNTQGVNVLATGPELYWESGVWRLVAKGQLGQVLYEESRAFDAQGLNASLSVTRELNSYSSLGLSVSYYENEYDELSVLRILDPANFGTNSTSTITFLQSDYEVIKYAGTYSRELPYGQLVAKLGYNTLSTATEDFDEPYYDVRLSYFGGGSLSGGATIRSELVDPVISSFNPEHSKLIAFEEGLEPPTSLGIISNPSYYLLEEQAIFLAYDVGRYHPEIRFFRQNSDHYGIEPSTDQTGFQFELEVELNSRSELNFLARGNTIDYTEVGIEDDLLELEFSYGYELFEGITVEAGYAYRDRSSNVDARGADDNIVFFEINYTGNDTGEEF